MTTHEAYTDSITVIQYFYFYPYNRWWNNHEGDWQRIHVVVSSRNSATAEVIGMEYLFHGAHVSYYKDYPYNYNELGQIVENTGQYYPDLTTSFVFKPRENLKLSQGTHPIVYVGAGSHAAYPTGGNYIAYEFAPLGVQLYSTPERMTHTGFVLSTQADNSHNDLWESYDLVLLPDSLRHTAINRGLPDSLSWLGADVLWGTPFVGGRGENKSPQGPYHKGWERLGFFQESTTGPSVTIIKDRIFQSVIPHTNYHHWSIIGNEVWNGTISLRGDVVVFPGATLTINAGTVIEFEPGKDRHKFSALGSVSDLAEIFVYGTLNAEGTSTSPIRFRRKSDTPAQAGYAWGGIRIMEGGSVDLDYTTIRNVPPPPPPTGLTAQAGTGQATLRWDAYPVDAGITEWQYRLKPEGVGWRDWQTMPNSEPLTAEHMVTGLIDGETSTFLVRAVNSTGAGSASAAVSVDIPLRSLLVKPTHTPTLTARAGDGEVTLSWDEPNAIQCTWQYQQTTPGFLAQPSEWENIPDSKTFTTEHTVGDLTNGLTYVFKVRAVNDYGQGPASAAVSVMPIAGGHRVPQQPTGLPPQVTGPSGIVPPTRPGQLYVSWAAVSATPAVNGYTLRYQSKPDLGVAISSWSDWCILPDAIAAGTTSYTHTGLSGDTLYRYQVRATNAQGNGAWSAAFPEAGLKPNSPPESPARRPSAPQNFMAAAANESVTLTWQAPANNGGATISDYKYRYRATESTRWSPSAEGVPLGQTTRSTVVENLTNGTPYTFQVWAVNRAGNGTSASVESTPGVVPPVPTAGLSATAGLNQITVSWDEVSAAPEVTGYKLQYRSAVVGTDNWSEYLPATTTGPDNRRYTHRKYGTVSVKYRFQYQVKALNDIGESDWSDSFPVEGAIPLPGHTTALDSMGVDNQNVTVRWECPNYGWCAPLDGASVAPLTLQSRRKSGSEAWTDWVGVTSSQQTTITHSVSSLDQAVVHRFQTRAVNANGGLGFGSESAVVVPLRAQAGDSDGTVQLGWDAPGRAVDAWQYRFKAGSAAWGTWQAVSASDRTLLSHAVSGLMNGVSYQFQVQAMYREEVKVVSFIQSATPVGTLSLTASGGDGQVGLSWTAPTNGSTIAHYQVRQRISDSGQDWSSWATVSGGSTARDTTVMGLTNGVTYQFQAQAIDSQDASIAVSDIVSATPAAVPDAPPHFMPFPGDGQVVLEWEAAANNGSRITHYEIQWRQVSDPAQAWSSWAPVSGERSARDTTMTGLTNEVLYEFAVRAVNGVGDGASISQAAMPRALSLTASSGDGQVGLRWTFSAHSATIAYYQVRQRISDSGQDWSSWATVSGGTTARDTMVTGLTNGETYQFQVQAIDSQDASVSVSNIVSATPQGALAVEVWFGSATYSAQEGGAGVSITVELSASPSQTLSIPVQVSKAPDTEASDYTVPNLTAAGTVSLSFGAGDRSQSFTITANEDADSVNETVSLTFGTLPSGVVAVGTTRQATVTLLDNDGVVSLSSQSPQEGTQLTATLTDASGGISSATWQWQRWSSTMEWENAAGTSLELHPWISIYTPQSGDVGHLLRATVSYTDADGPNQRAQSTATDAVRAAPPPTVHLTASGGDGQVALRWTVSAHSATIADYQVRRRVSDSGQDWSIWATVPGGSTARDTTVTGLTNGETYQFQVQAIDSQGTSVAVSNVESATPQGPLAIEVFFGSATYSAQEGAAGVSITVELSVSPSQTLSIPVQVSKAPDTEASDYTVPNLTADDVVSLSFGSADRLQSFTITANQDSDSDDETVLLTFGTLPAGVVAVGTTRQATVTLLDDDDPAGVVSLSSPSPQEDSQLTATLTDASGGISSATWHWQRWSSTMEWENAAGTSLQLHPWISIYTPQSGDVGHLLRATVSYDDRHGMGQTAQSQPTQAVRPAPSIDLMPVFASSGTTRSAIVGQSFSFSRPSASGGNAPLSYSVSGSCPGLTVSSSSVSGTPSLAVPCGISWTVRDTDGDTDTYALRLYVAADTSPAFASSGTTRSAIVGQSFSFSRPSASGGNAPLSYSVSGSCPGLTVSSSSVSGTPSLAVPCGISWTVTDADGDTDTYNIQITVSADTSPSFASSGTTRSAIVGQSFSFSRPSASGGNWPLSYSVSGSCPGLSVTSSSVSGTPSLAVPCGISWTVTDADGDTDTYNIQITVSADTTPSFASSGTSRSAIVGQSFSFTRPSASGGNWPLSYSVSGTCPGLTVTSSSVSGTPSLAVPCGISWTVSDTDGDMDTYALQITVSADTSPAFASSGTSRSAIVGQSFSFSRPSASGGNGSLSYSVSGTCPGLGVTSSSVSGTPSSSGPCVITWTVADTDGDTDTYALRLYVAADTSPAFASSSTIRTAIAGQSFSFSRPSASGGNGSLRYSVSGTCSGLTVTSSSVSGTPSSSGPCGITWTVTDADGDTDTHALQIYVAADTEPSFASSSTFRTATVGQSFSFSRPSASGGNGPLSYSVSGTCSGLTVTSSSVSGTPSGSGPCGITWTVTDADGDTDTHALQIYVSASTAFNLPSGGNGPLRSSIRGLPVAFSQTAFQSAALQAKPARFASLGRWPAPMAIRTPTNPTKRPWLGCLNPAGRPSIWKVGPSWNGYTNRLSTDGMGLGSG